MTSESGLTFELLLGPQTAVNCYDTLRDDQHEHVIIIQPPTPHLFNMLSGLHYMQVAGDLQDMREFSRYRNITLSFIQRMEIKDHFTNDVIKLAQSSIINELLASQS